MKRIILHLSCLYAFSVAFLITGCVEPLDGDAKHKDLPDSLRSILSSYAHIRKEQIEQIASKRNIAIAPEYKKFLDLAVKGDWEKAFRVYEKFRLRSYQWESNKGEDSAIANELWEPIHELGWGYLQFARWEPRLLQQFADDVLKAIPDGSIYFGGTDAGRFIISAFQTARKSPKIFVITQNNLLNSCYMDYLTDSYGGQIWTPSQTNVPEAIQECIGHQDQASVIRTTNGAVTINGVEGIMEVNGVLAEQMFRRNIEGHEIYVDEGYIMSWMYPYLEPHGLIMKLNKEKTELTEEVVKKDMDFWNQYAGKLMADKALLENRDARITFSKLRTSIAGLYKIRGRLTEAELAFKQSINLCPSAPEPAYRTAEFYAQQGRFDDARKVLEDFRRAVAKYWNADKNINQFLKEIEKMEMTRNSAIQGKK